MRLKIRENLTTTSLDPKFTGSYKKSALSHKNTSNELKFYNQSKAFHNTTVINHARELAKSET